MKVDRRLGLHNVDHDPDGAHLVAPTTVEIRRNFDAIDSVLVLHRIEWLSRL